MRRKWPRELYQMLSGPATVLLFRNPSSLPGFRLKKDRQAMSGDGGFSSFVRFWVEFCFEIE